MLDLQKRRASHARYRERNRERIRVYDESYRKANKDLLRIKQRKYREGDFRLSTLSKRFNLSQIEIQEILERQNFKCPVCNNPVTIRSALDHDHKTGLVRGFLCKRHNYGLAFFDDDPQQLRNAANYLETRSEISVAGNACREKS